MTLISNDDVAAEYGTVENFVKTLEHPIFYRYTKGRVEWFTFKRTHWYTMSTNEVEVFLVDWITKNDSNEKSTYPTYWNTVMRILPKLLEFTSDIRKEAGINFKNCFVSTKTGKRSNHDFKRFVIVTYCLDSDYHVGMPLSNDLKKYLLGLCGQNWISLCNLRAAIRRALDPKQNLQTAYFIYGRPGTGKTTFTTLIANIVGQDNVAWVKLPDLGAAFVRGDFINKSLIIISNVSVLGLKEAQSLRKILAHHYKNNTESTSNPVVFLTSNFKLGELVNKDNHEEKDVDLLNNLIPIHLPTCVDYPVLNLGECLLKLANELVSSAFSCTDTLLKAQVKVED